LGVTLRMGYPLIAVNTISSQKQRLSKKFKYLGVNIGDTSKGLRDARAHTHAHTHAYTHAHSHARTKLYFTLITFNNIKVPKSTDKQNLQMK
jgi:hypothetical protein